MNIILLGPPGCGKGTQSSRIIKEYDLKHVAPGDFIRHEIHAQSEIGKRVSAIVKSGHMIDEKTLMELVRLHTPQKNKLLFDGIPRTLSQAHLLEKEFHVDIVIDLQVKDADVIKRISSRWAVERDGEQFTFPDKDSAQEYVSEFGGEIFQRADDKPKVVQERLSVYHKETEPLIEYYGQQHKLYIVNGGKSIDNVWSDIQKILDKLHIKKKEYAIKRYAL